MNTIKPGRDRLKPHLPPRASIRRLLQRSVPEHPDTATFWLQPMLSAAPGTGTPAARWDFIRSIDYNGRDRKVWMMHSQSENASAHAHPRAATLPVVVVIPAYRPDQRLVKLASALARSHFRGILVVDDGSGDDFRPLFREVAKLRGCWVVHHAVNLGKGRAIKTGLNLLLLKFPGGLGAVTADADGQHTVEDISHVAEFLAANPRSFAIGVRSFSGRVPFRSQFGNRLTSFVFGCLTGKALHDTQSGLRAVPSSLIPSVLRLNGERYEFEIGMLLHAAKTGVNIHEIPIQTIYLNYNETSHFRPVRDSAQIYYKVLEFYASSALAALLDLVAFAAAYEVTNNLLFSFLVGRVLIAALVNFTINRRYVFKSRARLLSSLLRYYSVFAVIAVTSYVSIRALHGMGINPIFAKACVETILSILSFAAQGLYVFAERKIRRANGSRTATAV